MGLKGKSERRLYCTFHVSGCISAGITAYVMGLESIHILPHSSLVCCTPMISSHVGAVAGFGEAFMVRNHKPLLEIDLQDKEQRKIFMASIDVWRGSFWRPHAVWNVWVWLTPYTCMYELYRMGTPASQNLFLCV